MTGVIERLTAYSNQEQAYIQSKHKLSGQLWCYYMSQDQRLGKLNMSLGHQQKVTSHFKISLLMYNL